MQFGGAQIFITVVVAFFIFVVVVNILIFGKYLKLWTRAKMSGADVPLPILLLMRMRKSNVESIVDAKIKSTQAGLEPIPIHKLEAHNLAGGDSEKVVEAMIIAKNSDIEVQWETASQYDLAGRDVLEAIREEVVD